MRFAASVRAYEVVLVVAAVVLALAALAARDCALAGLVPRGRGGAAARRAKRVLVWFHLRIYQLAAVVSPDGVATGHVAVPLWVESEKLFVWALIVAVLGMLMRRQRDELLHGVMLVTAVLMFGAALLGKPFTAAAAQLLRPVLRLPAGDGGRRGGRAGRVRGHGERSAVLLQRLVHVGAPADAVPLRTAHSPSRSSPRSG